MGSVYWTPNARGDLQQIEDFIAEDSPEQAASFVEKLAASAARLADFPRIGQVVESLGIPEMRSLVFHDYRIFYRVEGERAVIHGVIHGAMDLGRVARRRRWNPPRG